MNRASLAVIGLGGLPFLYVAGVGLADLPGAETPLAAASFLAVLLLSVYFVLEPRRGPWIGGIGTAFFLALLGAAAVVPGAPGSPLDEVAWGVLLSSPILFLLHLVRPPEGPGIRLLGLQLAFADGLLLLATPGVVTSGGGRLDAAALLRGFFTTLDEQFAGVGRLASGGAVQNLPLQALNDPWFVGLAGLAVLATFLTFLVPSTGRSVPLPTHLGPAPGPGLPGETVSLSPSFRAALAARSLPRGAPPGRYPGAVAVLAVGGSGSILVGLAVVAPAAVFLAVIVGTLALVAMVVAALRRPIG